MPGRNFTASNYRYDFNGKESDKQSGWNTQDYGFRNYDPRLGRFFSIDPLKNEFPYYSPYQFAGNTPIQAIDLEGAKIYIVTANGTLFDATQVLLKTPSGRALLLKYQKSTTHDIYITISDKFKKPNETNQVGLESKILGLTTYDVKKFVREGRIIGLNRSKDKDIEYHLSKGDFKNAELAQEDRDVFSLFEGMDVSKSKDREISLIAINANESDKYDVAGILIHEIYAHIAQVDMGLVDKDDVQGQHDNYGETFKDEIVEGSTAYYFKLEIEKIKSIENTSNKARINSLINIRFNSKASVKAIPVSYPKYPY